ncbi:MAG TPA: glucuronate isomerase [Bryobacteraceae bacterium]|jgi:glucuronate isomerase
MAFITNDFLLNSRAASGLYHAFAAPEPIFDYHCHLSPREIAENRQFRNLTEIWLDGDHYKWRAMRANGVDERYCTGNADPFEKFLAWARTVPFTLRNPLYHWTHLELARYFGIEDLLNESTAQSIWDRANEQLQSRELSTQGILAKFNVKLLCTTDDPADDLACHQIIQASGLKTRVLPAFRPDKALQVHLPERFNAWVDRLASASNTDIRNLSSLLDALKQRHDAFHAMGARLSDHGLDRCYASFCAEPVAERIFDKARAGSAATPKEHEQFASYMMVFFGHLDAAKGWTKQLHLGAHRNASSRQLREIGPDCGFDSMGDAPQIEALGAYLDRLDAEHVLPKMILYNVNPADNYALATMAGNFRNMHFGGAWWFMDQKEGMEWQLNALSNAGLLSRFVGMLTDSRSFMSYPRHEYYRRVLCNLIGRDIENGEIPDDNELVGPMIRGLCYGNARDYFGFEGVN